MNTSTEPNSNMLLARRKSLFLHIHFWAALIASPFAIVAACTGLLYVFTPQIEDVLYAELDHVQPTGKMRSLDEVIASAQAAATNGLQLKSVVPAQKAGDSVKVYFAPASKTALQIGEHHHEAASDAFAAATSTPIASIKQSAGFEAASAQNWVMYLNPYTAEILGTQIETERFNLWARKLHSSLLQGDGWRWMIELTASWLMVMLLTGIYLWWPRSTHDKTLPQAGAKGRVWWKQWHAFIGVALSLMSLAILTTGLTWSKTAGSQIRSFRDVIGQAPPQIPRDLQSSLSSPDAQVLTWQSVWELARQQTDVAVQITPPKDSQSVWRIANFDKSQPTKKLDLALDAYTGKVLYRGDWSAQTTFAQATALGIPFHRGELGVWNQVLLFLFGSGILFSLLSGWVMVFKRRRAGLAGLPKLLPGAWRSAPLAVWIIAPVLMIAMPLLALTVPLVVLLEVVLGRAQPDRSS